MLAKQFQIESQVAFTEFQWWQSMDRAEMVELMRLCDIRLTTSAGEGFGVPIIEAAASNPLQIVDGDRAAPELRGKDNPCVVPPASIESRMLSLWAMPNTSEMVRRTVEFIHDPHLTNHALESSRLWVEGKFQSSKIAAQFIQTFTNARAAAATENLDITRCWGLQDAFKMPSVFGDCGRALMRLTKKPVLELGARDGTFVEVCAELGVNIIGMEDRPDWLNKLTSRARPFIQPDGVAQPWPAAGAVVATDMQDVWLDELGSLEAVEEILKKIAFYDWAVLRFKSRHIWGKPTINKESCHSILRANGLTRREDLEGGLRGKFPNFQHELWQSAVARSDVVEHFLGM